MKVVKKNYSRPLPHVNEFLSVKIEILEITKLFVFSNNLIPREYWFQSNVSNICQNYDDDSRWYGIFFKKFWFYFYFKWQIVVLWTTIPKWVELASLLYGISSVLDQSQATKSRRKSQRDLKFQKEKKQFCRNVDTNQ